MRTRFLFALLLLPGTSPADELFLKGGGRVSGVIVSRTDTTIEVDVGAGRIGVPASSVVRIEEGRSALHEYQQRASTLAASDVEGWLALGDWASGQALATQANEAYARALSASPQDPRANAALGNVQVEGRWMSEADSYRARGFVQFEGEWMTPAEQDALLRERAADADRERERLEAETRVREAEARAEEAEARAREAEAEAASDVDDYWYGWGGGPAYWPSGTIATRPARPVARPRAVPR